MNNNIKAFTPVRMKLTLESSNEETKCNLEIEFTPSVNIWEFLSKDTAIDIFKESGFTNISIDSKPIEKKNTIYTLISFSGVYPSSLSRFELIHNRIQNSIRRLLKKLPVKVNL